MKMRTSILLSTLALLLALLGACSQSDFGKDDAVIDPPGMPGSSAWDPDDVSCESVSDCGPNETCLNGTCLFAQCDDGPYASSAPVGDRFIFFNDKEIIAADGDSYQGSYWVDAYMPNATSATYPTGGGSLSMSTRAVVDVAGGNVFGDRPEAIITAHQGSHKVIIKRAGKLESIDVGFQPIAVAAGDTDNDGVEEVIALSSDGKFAVCDIINKSCLDVGFAGDVEGIDVAAGDVDGDGSDEPVFLIKYNGNHQILVYNRDSEASGESSTIGGNVDGHIALDVGDLDGDGVAEIVALRDRGLFGLQSDHLNIYTIQAGSLAQVANISVDSDSRDVSVDDLDADGRAEVLLLHDTRTVQVFRATSMSNLESRYTSQLSVTNDPRRIASVDFDGNSPSARLVGGPELLPGAVVPTMVLEFPPYSQTYSDGLPHIFIGDSQKSSDTFSDSVSLEVGIEFGVEPGIEGLFKASLSTRLSSKIETKKENQVSRSIGLRISIEPNEALHGNAYSAVVVSSSCYHKYIYELEDPSNLLKQGGDGGQFVVLVPVAGRSTVWSNRRYNALAKVMGGLPIVQPQGQLGEPTSFPSVPSKPDGSPIPASDLVFRDSPVFITSDIGKVGWWLSFEESTTNETSMFSAVSISASVSVAGFKVGGSVTQGFRTTHGVRVGHEVLFGGGVPPIPDNPDTPEDEYAAHHFSFAPVVYRQTYEDAAGNEAGYYVLTYTVGR